MNSGIYKLMCEETGDFYIGSSQKLRKRSQDHFSLLKNNKHPNIYLQRVYNKYGKLKFLIVERCKIDNLIEREQHYIDILNPKYNLRPIAESNRGWRMPDSAKQKISEFNKGKSISEEHKRSISEKNSKNLKGRKLDPSHIEAIRQSRIGIKLSEETKEKIRIKAIGRNGGKILSEGTKKKIAITLGKEVFQYSIEGNFINSYLSASEAARQVKGSNSAISSCCRNERKTHKNFKWYYEKQNN